MFRMYGKRSCACAFTAAKNCVIMSEASSSLDNSKFGRE